MPKLATKKRINIEQIGRAFDTMQGNSETRLKKLVEETGIEAERLIKSLATYRARQWVRQEFPNMVKGGGKEPPKSKKEILAALNKVGSIVRAAKLLKTTPITLNKWIVYFQLKQITEYGPAKKVTWT